jgi:hypothetical protein
MAAFLVGTPIMAKTAAKPTVARRTTAVRAAASSEYVCAKVVFNFFFRLHLFGTKPLHSLLCPGTAGACRERKVEYRYD